MIGGTFVIRAESYDHAVSLLEECPHLDYGVIEIREIQKL